MDEAICASKNKKHIADSGWGEGGIKQEKKKKRRTKKEKEAQTKLFLLESGSRRRIHTDSE